jgi:protein-S-isoprenylcysteine O-methyltransferase Ste14
VHEILSVELRRRLPIYVGGGLRLNSRWIVLLAVVVAGGITRAIIVRDERLLEKRFGDEYRAYRSRVRRWL